MNKLITLKKYSSDDKDKWNEFLYKAKNGIFMFDRNYMEYHHDRFKDHSLMFYDNDELIAIFPANESDDMLKSHGGLTYGGLIMSDSVKQHTIIDCFDILKEYSKERGFKYILYKAIPHIYHVQPAEEDIYALYRQGAKIDSITASTVINLNKPLKMPKGRKAQISRAKREGVIIRKLEEKKDYSIFIELENNVLRSRHGISAVHSGEEMFMLYERFPNNICLYGAIYENKIIAGTVVFIYGNVIHTQYMAAGETAREIGALDLTISTVIDEYKGRKAWLDFGISTDHEGMELNSGLIFQKEGFGGRTNIYSTWMLSI